MSDLKSILDPATQVLIDLNEEAEGLKVKFGERSKIYLAKRKQIDLLFDMQDALVKEINELNRMLKLSELNCKIMEMSQEAMIESIAAGVHTDYLFLYKPTANG